MFVGAKQNLVPSGLAYGCLTRTLRLTALPRVLRTSQTREHYLKLPLK